MLWLDENSVDKADDKGCVTFAMLFGKRSSDPKMFGKLFPKASDDWRRFLQEQADKNFLF